MARSNALSFLGRLLPRFPLEMTVACLATFLGTAVIFDLPHRWNTPEAAPAAPEKLSLQAEPLPIHMFRPSEEHEASTFMEAVALSHVAPLRPQGEVDRAAADPPPAVQVLARSPSREKPRPLAAAQVPLPQPAPRPAVKVAVVPPAAAQPAAPEGELRPPAQIPVARSPERHRFDVPGIGDMARSARSTVSDGIDSLGRSVSSLIGWR
jgi:hypothetical protein